MKAKQNNMPIRRLAIAFSVFLIFVIVAADLGYLSWVLWLVNRVENFDKVLHFLLIGILTYLVTVSVIETLPNRNLNWIVSSSVFFFLSVFTLEEISQGPIRGRDFSLEDLAANYLGILFFGFLAWWRYRKRL